MCTGGRATHRLQHRAASRTPQICPVKRASTLALTLVRPDYIQISINMRAVAVAIPLYSLLIRHLIALINYTPLQEAGKTMHHTGGSNCRTVLMRLG